MKKSLSLVGTLALAAALYPAAFAQDQSTSPSQQDQSSQSQGSKDQGMSQSQPDQGSSESATSYTGTVMKTNGKYVLKTDSATIQLDDQSKAKKYNGKQVTVNGTVDKSTGMLHVTDIVPASSSNNRY
jgi:lipopolysaccharide export system protein LptA